VNIKKTIIITFATMTLLLGFSKADNTYADQVEFEDSIVRAAETGLQSMVHIHSGIGSGGTGFYITPNTILTNEHVIRDAKEGVPSGKCGFTTLSTFSRRFPHF
jgi:V8-like Glu-specific endopeptidase